MFSGEKQIFSEIYFNQIICYCIPVLLMRYDKKLFLNSLIFTKYTSHIFMVDDLT
jgi:hypothetical protein